jgi:murein DD-endopeptidase MepM/ murein hydrolase activator NlpD
LNIGTLLAVNGLTPQKTLVPGQRLTVPAPSEIVIIRGDTVDTISRAFGVSRDAIIRFNHLPPPYYLERGSLLRIPPRPAKKQPENKLTRWFGTMFGSDDTAETAVTKSGEAATPITTTQTATGSKIHSSASGVIMEDELAPPVSVTADKPMDLTPAVPARVEPVAPLIPAVVPKRQPVTAGPVTLSWPVNGTVLSGFGPKAGGIKNEGINIGAPLGTPVRVAAAGEVVYMGNNVAGFGNLILVRHADGLATAYGHVQNPLVKRGDAVSAGQAIAQIGKTGNVNTPQLHFEVRKGTEPVNPESYLP